MMVEITRNMIAIIVIMITKTGMVITITGMMITYHNYGTKLTPMMMTIVITMMLKKDNDNYSIMVITVSH